MNFKGGYKIIDLRSLTLTPSEDGTTYIDIEDPKVLSQLDSLKEYLDVSKDLKPIYLRVTDNDTVMCELKRDIEHSTFYIHAILMGYVLMISAAFTQDEETLLWSISAAAYLYVSDEVKLENGVKPIIEADKDVLSQITAEYDENTQIMTITFPKNILPLRYYFDELNSNLYFDYFNNAVYKDNQIDVNFEVLNQNGKVIIRIENIATPDYPYPSPLNDDLDYCYFNAVIGDLNTYNLYYPAPAGTKLYLHKVDFDTDIETEQTVYIISTDDEQYDTANDINSHAGDIIGVQPITFTYDGDRCYPFGLELYGSTTAILARVDRTFQSVVVEQVTGDIVTEL